MPKGKKIKVNKGNNSNMKASKELANHQRDHEQFLQQREGEKTSFELLIQNAMQCNPKLGLFLLSLMAGAGAIGLYNSMNWNNNSNNDNSNSISTKSPLVKQDSCKTAIFYEVHTDPSPTKTVTSLLPVLTKHNYTTFAFEEPRGRTIPESKAVIENEINGLKNWIKNAEGSSVNYKVINLVKGGIEMYLAQTKLLQMIEDQGLNYVAVDIDSKTREQLDFKNPRDPYHTNARDQHMADSIHQACHKFKSGVVFVVGNLHVGINKILEDKYGHQIVSAFIIDHPPLSEEGADNNWMLRSRNEAYMKKHGYGDTFIINHYDDPSSAEINLAGLTRELEGKNEDIVL